MKAIIAFEDQCQRCVANTRLDPVYQRHGSEMDGVPLPVLTFI